MFSKVKALLSKPLFCQKMYGEGRSRAFLIISAFLFFLPVLLATGYSQTLPPNPFGISFAPAVNYGAGDAPYSVFCADLDGDTDLDLAVANTDANSVSILKNNGNGTYQTALNYEAGYNSQSVFCADLDGDTDLDLAVANGGVGVVSILMNDGTGAFSSPVPYGAGLDPKSVFCADLDGDIDLDLAVANAQFFYGDDDLDLAIANSNFFADSVSILKNNGNGTFQTKVSYAAGGGPYSVFCADLDNDNDLDLAVANHWGQSLSILENNGNATFQAPVNYAPGGGGIYPNSVFCARLNNDDYLDVVVANGLTDNVWVLMNNGDGTATLGPIVYYSAGDAPSSVFCVDLEGDNDIDMVVADQNGDNVSILQNNGYGNFSGAGSFGAGDGPLSVFCADLDGDADPEVAVANVGSDNVSILENGSFIDQFTPPQNYPVGEYPYSVFCVDLDGDADLDLVVPNEVSDNTYILKNNGDGSFFTAGIYNFGGYSCDCFSADLDGDGDLDIAGTFDDVTHSNYGVTICRNLGDGSFADPESVHTGPDTKSVFSADLDNDADLDLAVAYAADGGGVSIFMNNGDATFSDAVNYPAGYGASSVFSADFDRDKDMDLAVSCYGSGNVAILMNNGSGTFTSPLTYSVETYPLSVFCADLDGDSDLDLAVANGGSNSVSILKNDGHGSFVGGADHYAAGLEPHSVFCSDLDGDGDQDLVVAGYSSHKVSVLTNYGDGTFADAVEYGAGQLPRDVFSADMDADGDLDMAVINSSSDNVSILKNVTNTTANRAPWAFSLISPENGATTLGSATFRWHIPYDPNFGDQFRYDLYISTTPGFESPTIIPNLAVSKYEVALGDGDYYWKVKAKDNWGAERWSTETWFVQFHYMDDGVTVIAYSPVDLIVTDPLADSVSLWFNTIPNATYDTTTDYNQDGDKDDIVTIPHRLVGEYIIEVVAEPGGSGTYELGIRIDGGAPAMLTMPGGNPCPGEGEVDTSIYYAPWYKTGDANGDWAVDVGDVICLINYLYKNGPAPYPLESGDANCSGVIEVGDVLYLINYLFKGGPAPAC